MALSTRSTKRSAPSDAPDESKRVRFEGPASPAKPRSTRGRFTPAADPRAVPSDTETHDASKPTVETPADSTELDSLDEVAIPLAETLAQPKHRHDSLYDDYDKVQYNIRQIRLCALPLCATADTIPWHTTIAVEVCRNQLGHMVFANYALGVKVAEVFNLDNALQDQLSLRLLPLPLNILSSSTTVPTLLNLLDSSAAVTTSPLSSLTPLRSLASGDDPEVRLADPTCCTRQPKDDEGLLVQCILPGSSAPTTAAPPPSTTPLPHLASLSNPNTSTILALPPPPPAHVPHTSLSAASLPPPPAPSPSLHLALPVPPTLDESSSTTPSTSDAPLATAYDVYQPQGTWERFVELSAAQVNDGVIWALRDTGGQHSKKLPKHDGSGTAVEYGGKMWPTRSRKCAGLYQCTRKGCSGIDRPAAKDAHGARTCNNCRSAMVHVDCTARWNVATVKLDDGMTRKFAYHEGWHRHAPPPVRRVTTTMLEAAAPLWLANPQLTPAEAITGNKTFDPGHPAHRASVADINPRFTSSRAVADLRDKALDHAGAPRPTGHANKNRHAVALDHLANLSRQKPDAFSAIDIRNGALSIPLQTDDMRRWLNTSDEHVELAQAIRRGGLSTDAHNTFFDGSWILIQTVTFLDSCSRWVPVLYTIADHETAEVYRRHFRRILDSFDSSLDMNGIDDRFLHVADFSSAQALGFRDAYVEFVVEKQRPDFADLAAARTAATARADELIRGCQRHLEANIEKCARSHRITDANRESFIRRTKSLFAAGDRAELDRRRGALLRDFPDVRRWLDWWTTPRILRLIARAEMQMSPEDQAVIPVSSNAVEAAHKVLICGAGGEKFGLEVGLEKLLDAIHGFVKREEGAANGHAPPPLSATPALHERPPARRNTIPSSYRNTEAPPPNAFLPAGNAPTQPCASIATPGSDPTPQPPPPAPVPPSSSSSAPCATLAFLPASADAILDPSSLGTFPSAPAPPTPSFALPPSTFSTVGVSTSPAASTSAASISLDTLVVSCISGWPRRSDGVILETEWRRNSCWLDASLVCFCAQMRENRAGLAVSDFYQSSASQTPAFLECWRRLDAFVRLHCDVGSGMTARAFRSHLSAARDELRLALAHAGVLISTDDSSPSTISQLVTQFQSDEWWLLGLLLHLFRNEPAPHAFARLFSWSEARILPCLDGHIRFTPHAKYNKESIQLERHFHGSEPPPSLQNLLDPAVKGGQTACSTVKKCANEHDAIRLCNAPAAELSRYTHLPFFLSFSVNGIHQLPSPPPTSFFSDRLEFDIDGVKASWELTSRLEYSSNHFTAIVRTGASEWTHFDSHGHGSRGTIPMQSTSCPPMTLTPGQSLTVRAYYRFTGSEAEWVAFNSHLRGTSLARLGLHDASPAVFGPDDLDTLRRSANEPIEHTFFVTPSREVYDMPSTPAPFVLWRHSGNAMLDSPSMRFYTIFDGTSVASTLFPTPTGSSENLCFVCGKNCKLMRGSLAHGSNRQCVRCHRHAHMRCLGFRFAQHYLCERCRLEFLEEGPEQPPPPPLGVLCLEGASP